MRRLISLLLALLLLFSLTACGTPPVSSGGPDTGAADAADDEALPEAEAPPEPEPYDILDPTVMPEGGVRDGVAYAAWDGIVEHLFFHPVVAGLVMALVFRPGDKR